MKAGEQRTESGEWREDNGMTNRKAFDYVIFITALILLSIGITMVFSASSAFSFYRFDGDSYKFLKQQLLWALLGFIAMLAMVSYDYRKLGKLSGGLLIISVVALVAVLILPRVGETTAKRWIGFGGPFTIQPSEIAKLAVILFFSYSLSKRKDQLKYFMKGLVPYLIIVGIIAGLLILEPHYSTTVVIMVVSVVILFCAGARISHFVLLAVPIIPVMILGIILEPYRLSRVMTFMNPFRDVKGASWQIVQSLYAIGSGGLFGRGLGRSLQKFLYIPEPHNDFIFAILCEELGFIGAFTVLLLFIIFIWRGLKVAMSAPDLFGSLMAVGITSLVAVQVIVNVAVVTSSMPVTGMPLPFFSYGGSSLIFLMADIGILLNISRYCNSDKS